MCVNKEVSLILFIMGTITSIKAVYKGFTNPKLFNVNIQLAVFIFAISIMQLLEFILWSNQTCNETNKIVTYLIPLTLIIQPISYFLISDYLGIVKKYRPILYFLSLLLFLLCLLNIFYVYPKSDNVLCSVKDEKSCRLEWNSITETWDYSKLLLITVGSLYFIIFGLTNFSFKSKDKSNGIVTYSIMVAFLASIIYSLITNKNNIISINGSFFCFLVVILVILT